MLAICRSCKNTQFHAAKGGLRLADVVCYRCRRVGLNKLNAEENSARQAVNRLKVDRLMAVRVAMAVPSDRALLEEIHEMLRLSLSAQLAVLPGPQGRRIALAACKPKLTLLRGGLNAAETGRAA